MNDFKNSHGFYFVLPMLLGIVAFVVIPAIMAVGLSLHQWSFTKPPQWVGLLNYQRILGIGCLKLDPLFWQALGNTLVMATVVPLQVAGSFMLARFLSSRSRWNQFLRLIVFIPTMVSPVALYIMWRWILNSDFGLVSQLLNQVGLSGISWLEDPAWSKPAVMIVILWETVGGFQMLFFLAGFRQIPQQLHDMALLEGLNFRQKTRDIYWPWLKYLVFFNFCMGFLGAMQGGFEIAYIMTGGGPLRSTTTLSFFLFENSFQWQRVGYAAAVGMVMFVLVLPLLLISGISRSWKGDRNDQPG